MITTKKTKQKLYKTVEATPLREDELALKQSKKSLKLISEI
jgi:hypothetical protein